MGTSLNNLRDDLIASLHSDQVVASKIGAQLGDLEFVRNLIEVCAPFDDYTNDPRMEAAYYLSVAPIGSLLPIAANVEELLRLPLDGDAMDDSISYHLVRCLGRLALEGGFVLSQDLAHHIEGG